MKIRIVTFHREVNYGANLQAYALRYYLTTLGHEVSFIDFRRHQRGHFAIRFARKWIGKSFSSTLVKVRTQCRTMAYVRKCRPVFEKFQQQFIPTTSETYYSAQSIKKNPPQGDCYVVGSDQVWSLRIVADRDLPAYFLDFGNPGVKRIAYAVSSGGEVFPVKYRANITKYLSSFLGIGVREESLGEHIAKIAGVKTSWTPDPTVLLDWRSHLDIASVRRDAALGLFILSKASYAKISFEGFALNEELTGSGGGVVDFSNDLNDPIEWIKQIAAKRLLITDSYHAVLFALYTETPFLFIKWGVGHNRDQRIIALLDKLNLADRAVSGVTISQQFDEDILSVNWSAVSKKIVEMRRSAEEFLQTNLE